MQMLRSFFEVRLMGLPCLQIPSILDGNVESMIEPKSYRI